MWKFEGKEKLLNDSGSICGPGLQRPGSLFPDSLLQISFSLHIITFFLYFPLKKFIAAEIEVTALCVLGQYSTTELDAWPLYCHILRRNTYCKKSFRLIFPKSSLPKRAWDSGALAYPLTDRWTHKQPLGDNLEFLLQTDHMHRALSSSSDGLSRHLQYGLGEVKWLAKYHTLSKCQSYSSSQMKNIPHDPRVSGFGPLNPGFNEQSRDGGRASRRRLSLP